MGPHAPQHRHPSSGRGTSVHSTRRPLAVLLLAASLTAVLPAPSRAGQLLGGLLDKPLSNLLSTLPRGTTRVIVRTDRGALSVVLRLVTALGGRVVAQHPLIDALTIELPLVQVALVARLPGVLSISLDCAGGERAARRHRPGRIAPGGDAGSCRSRACSAPRPTAAASASP